jgi:hypothetical protein
MMPANRDWVPKRKPKNKKQKLIRTAVITIILGIIGLTFYMELQSNVAYSSNRESIEVQEKNKEQDSYESTTNNFEEKSVELSEEYFVAKRWIEKSMIQYEQMVKDYQRSRNVERLNRDAIDINYTFTVDYVKGDHELYEQLNNAITLHREALRQLMFTGRNTGEKEVAEDMVISLEAEQKAVNELYKK